MFTRLIASLLPLRCPGCGVAAEPVCDRCAATMRAAPHVAPPHGVDAWVAPFAYDGVARELVARVKYRGLHAATGWLAEQMVMLVAPPVPIVVTWAPTTAPRRRARGFDHAELLAGAVARLLGRRTLRALTRGPGDPQTGRAAAERRIGPAFAPRAPVPRSVLLVDDVATTGATAAAAAAALRVGGASRVVVLTAARTPSPLVDAASGVSSGVDRRGVSSR